MSVPAQTPFVSYTGNGLTTSFAFPFYLLDVADIQVSLNGVVGLASYTVTGVGQVAGGSVNFAIAPPVGVPIYIQRAITLARYSDYQYQGDLKAATLNADFDRIYMVEQDNAFKDLGNLKAPFPEQPSVLPSAAARANMLLSFDANGNPIVSAPAAGTATALALQLASSTGAAGVGFSLSYTGAAALTLAAILASGPLTPQAFGAIADGRNCSDAFDLVCFASQISGKSIRLPSGGYGVVRPIPFALNGGSCDSFEGSGIGCQIVALPSFVGSCVLDARQVGGRTIRNLLVDCGGLADVIGIDTSWPIVGSSVQNIYNNVFVQNHAATAWKAWNDNDTSFSRVTTRGAKTAGLFGIDLTAGGGAISMDDVICADSSISVTCQNGGIEGGYSNGIRLCQNGATGTNILSINNHQIYCSPTAISSASPATPGNYTNGLVYSNSNVLALRNATGDNSSFLLDVGVNGTIILENIDFNPPSATNEVPNPLFRLFGPNFKDQGIPRSKVILRDCTLNGLDTFCYAGGSPIVILEDCNKAGVGLVNDQQGMVRYRGTVSPGPIATGAWVEVIPEGVLENFDACHVAVLHTVAANPFYVAASALATFIASAAGSSSRAIGSTSTDYFLGASTLSMRFVAPTVAGHTPSVQVSPNYSTADASTLTVVVTRLGNPFVAY